MKRIILSIMILPCAFSSAVAQEQTPQQLREEALRLFKESNTAADYASAEGTIRRGVELLQQAAQQNDAEAQFVLGTLVLTQSLPPGIITIDAKDMLLRAARQGHVDALYGLCALAFQGALMTPEDEAWILKELEKKDAEGNKEAAAVLAPMYFLFDEKEAFNARLAKLTPQADGGDVEAQYLMGTILLDPAGLGFPKDMVKGIAYLEQASAANHRMAQLFLGEMYVNNEEIKDIDKGLKHLEAAAQGGDPQHQTQVGILYYQLGRSEEDYKKAFQWLSAAAAQNVREAQFYLANMYQKGIGGVAVDTKKAEELLKESEKP